MYPSYYSNSNIKAHFRVSNVTDMQLTAYDCIAKPYNVR